MTSRPSAPDVVQEIGPPLFGLKPGRLMNLSVGGWGTSGASLQMQLRHRWGETWVEVHTAKGPLDPASQEEQSCLIRWFLLRTGELTAEDFPIHLEIAREEISIEVDGRPAPFVRLGDDSAWVAYGLIGDRRVRIDARSVHPDEVQLVTIDSADYF